MGGSLIGGAPCGNMVTGGSHESDPGVGGRALRPIGPVDGEHAGLRKIRCRAAAQVHGRRCYVVLVRWDAWGF